MCICFLYQTSAHSFERKNYIFTTATAGGTYYPVGVALATLTKVKLEPEFDFSLSAIRSAGSAENLSLLRENRAQFAILQGLYGAWAWSGLGELENAGPQTDLRSVTMLWQNVEHFVVKSDHLQTGNIADLKGIKSGNFSIGKKNSGTAGSGRYILDKLDLKPEKNLDIVYLGYEESSEGMQNGTVEGMNMSGGPPIAAMTRTFAALGEDVTILNFSDKQLEKINSELHLWKRYIIPANSYPGQHQAVESIGQPNFIAVRSDVEDDVVYLLVKAIYENLSFLHNIHIATKPMAIEHAVEGLPVPLHPGAARFYREQGIEIPERLIVR